MWSKIGLVAAVVLADGVSVAQADIRVTEVYSAGSSNTSYAADWFELTNTGSSAVDITGWKVDDSSNAFGSALALQDVTSIPAGASVVFMEGNSSGTDHDAKKQAFKDAWFGSNVPANFLIGTYGGSGIGLSSGGDAVNIFDSLGNPVTSVDFSAATTGFTFDNAAGNSGTISALSAVATDGAFTSFDGFEVGSPGTIGSVSAVPEPASVGMLVLGGLMLLRRRRGA
jgi:hypothetical protein